MEEQDETYGWLFGENDGFDREKWGFIGEVQLIRENDHMDVRWIYKQKYGE